MQCSNCGHDIIPGAEFCGNCGARIVAQAPAPGQTPNQPQIVNGQPLQAVPVAVPVVTTATVQPGTAPATQAYAVVKQPSSGLSITGMILGILSLLGIIWIFPAIALGIAAIIFSVIGKKKGGKGMAITGIVTGIIGIVLAILWFILLAAVIANCKTSTSESCRNLNEKSSQSLINVTPPIFNQG